MRNRRKAGTFLITAGILLLAAALALTGYNLYDDYRAGRSADHILESLEQTAASSDTETGRSELPDCVINPDTEMPVTELEGNEYIGILQIPSLKLTLPVISRWSYKGLKIAPCRYSGSVYSGSMVIAGHNYRSCFGKIGSLTEGDQVIFTDVKGRVFLYEAAGTEIVNAYDIQGMTGEDWALTLFSCTPGGKFRVAVRCRNISH